MQPFVINRHDRLVFPSNFLPDLDFSVIETEEQLDQVIRRDFETKAPSGTEIGLRIEQGKYKDRVALMRDVALNLFWVNRFAMTMYEKVPTRWRDVPRTRGDIFLPVVQPWLDKEGKVAAVENAFASLPSAGDADTEEPHLGGAVRPVPAPQAPRQRAGGDSPDGCAGPAGSDPADLPAGHLRPGLPGVLLRRHRRLPGGCRRTGGAAPVGDGAAQPVPVGSRRRAADRAGRSLRRRCGCRLQAEEPGGDPVPAQGHPGRAAGVDRYPGGVLRARGGDQAADPALPGGRRPQVLQDPAQDRGTCRHAR